MAASTKSYIKYELSGTARNQFPFEFPYFNVSDITVELPPGYTGTYTINASTNTVELSSPISVGTVLIRRHTTQSVKHIFANMMRFNFKTVDENFKQCLYWFQEALDSIDFLSASAIATRIDEVETEAASWVAAEAAARNTAISNERVAWQQGDTSLSQQLTTTLAAPTGAALIGFIQDGVGASKRSLQDRMRETISVKDFGAYGDSDTNGSSGHDDTAAIQAALTAGGPGSRIKLPRGFYKVSGTLNKYPGQWIEGDGWETVVGTYNLSGGSVIVQTSTSDIATIQTIGASDSAQKERGGLKSLAIKNAVTNATYGTGILASNSRQQYLEDVYVSSFNTGITQGANCWQWSMRGVRVMDAAQCLFAQDEGEDSTYVSCVFRSYRSGGIGVRLKNMSQTSLFLGCDMSNGMTAVWMEQGDNAGNGTGTPYPMHATFINCQFEELSSEAIKVTSSNSAAAYRYHPQVLVIGCRAYNFSNPNAGQHFVSASSASLIKVEGLQSSGYSTGISIGANVGQVIWKPGPGAAFNTSHASGAISRIFDSPSAIFNIPASIDHVAGNFTVIPFTAPYLDQGAWASGNGVKPGLPQAARFRVKLYTANAPAGRYAVIVKKNGLDFSGNGAVDTYISTSGQPALFTGEVIDIPSGSDEYAVVLYSTASFTVDTSTQLLVDLIGS